MTQTKTYEELQHEQQRHWTQTTRQHAERMAALRQLVESPFTCCGTQWPRGGVCPTCHQARVF